MRNYTFFFFCFTVVLRDVAEDKARSSVLLSLQIMENSHCSAYSQTQVQQPSSLISLHAYIAHKIIKLIIALIFIYIIYLQPV